MLFWKTFGLPNSVPIFIVKANSIPIEQIKTVDHWELGIGSAGPGPGRRRPLPGRQREIDKSPRLYIRLWERRLVIIGMTMRLPAQPSPRHRGTAGDVDARRQPRGRRGGRGRGGWPRPRPARAGPGCRPLAPLVTSSKCNRDHVGHPTARRPTPRPPQAAQAAPGPARRPARPGGRPWHYRDVT